MNIFHVLSSFGTTATARRLADVAKAGRKLKHHVVSLSGDLTMMAAMPAKTTSEAFLARRGRPDHLGLRQRLVASSADILCTYGWEALDAAVANMAGPTLAHFHHVAEEEAGEAGDKSAARLRGLAATGGVIVVTSLGAAIHARKEWRIPRANLRVIQPGVDLKIFKPLEHRAGEGELVTIGFVGELTNEKDVVTLIRGFAGIRARSSARLAIHAEGAARPAVDSLVRSLALRDRAFFREPVEPEPAALAAAYDEFDVFIPDRQTPARLQEAMACGLPAAGQDFGDIKRLVAAENRSLIVAPGDSAGLSMVLSRLVNDHVGRLAIGAANAARIRQDFPLSKMTAAYLALYREAVAD
jgi:glycosyltransferase involved in cell wall biosynthesis